MSDNKDCVKIQLLIEEAERLPKDEQMRRWHVLHGGMSRWESDK
jgi:hypothetical protein